MAATPEDGAAVGRIEHEITRVRGDLGRTVQEIGARLTPAHIMEQAKLSLREGTAETTRALAQSATDAASDVASMTRDAAFEARDQVRAHPYVVGAIGAGIGLGYWLVVSLRQKRRRLVPREWDEPFDRSSRRRASKLPTPSRLVPFAAAAAAGYLLWANRR